MQSGFNITQFGLCFGNNIIYVSVKIPGKNIAYIQLMEITQTLYYWIDVFFIFTPTVSQRKISCLISS